ncbi:MAG: hypothetical protein ISS45_03845 [Candidatus Omnitrophica bacterium]|nr:hypothetical protein [Candidatus Omnitrophota bacterium]
MGKKKNRHNRINIEKSSENQAFLEKSFLKYNLGVFILFCFFVALIPMANIMPINATIADHWLYLPCFGFFLAVVGGVSDWIGKSNQKLISIILF